MGAARAYGPKVWKTFMSIDISENKRLRSARTLICSGSSACEGQALALRGAGRVFFGALRGTGPRDCSLILAILFILAILLQTIAIKGLTDLFSVLRLRSIDIKVLRTFGSSCTSYTSWPSCFRHLNAGEGQALSLRPAPRPL